MRAQVEADRERVEASAALQSHMERHGEEEAAVRVAEEDRAREAQVQLEKSTGEGLSKEFLFLVGKVKKVEGRLKEKKR